VNDVPDALRSALGERYEVQRVLGRGGMATVYLANDHKHHRQVALKVLRPDLAASIGSSRFLQEIEIAARLTHPHILALHDSGEAGGFLYYVMPFIDGGSLRSRLTAARRLEPPAALAIARPVAGALAYAHRMGVLHRDIKPENILFAQGLPVVADFGIAKAISTAGGENLTRTGFPLGTPGYMSPEQAAGLTDLDPRTDVYSLAVVCYEMLVGETPGRWPTEASVLEGRFLEAPMGHRAVLATLPPAIEPALVRAMAIRLDLRTPAPEELLADLTAAAPRKLAAVAPPRRRFSEGEVQEIMRRAAELDAASPTMSGALTIGAIEQAAQEAGIPAEFVRQVAEQVRGPEPVPARAEAPGELSSFKGVKPFSSRWWLGAPTRLLVERVVPGEIAEADCAYLVEEIRTVIGNSGIVSTLGRSVSWVTNRASGSGVGRDLQVTITVRGGQTRITLQERLGAMAGGIMGGFGGGVGLGGLGPIVAVITESFHAPLTLLVIAPLWIVTALSGARSIFYYSVRSRERQLQGLGDRLAQMTASLIREAALPGPESRAGLLPR